MSGSGRGKKRRNVEEGDEEEYELTRAALPVGEVAADVELDGLSYLALVRSEREDPRYIVTIAATVDDVAEPRHEHLPADPWISAFGPIFGKLRDRFGGVNDPGESQLSALRQRFRGVTDELCKDLFCFAASLSSPLSASAVADLSFFLRKLSALPAGARELDAAEVAAAALASRIAEEENHK